MENGQIVDAAKNANFNLVGAITHPTVDVDTAIAPPNPGATLTLTLHDGSPADTADTVTGRTLTGFPTGTVVADGSGGHTVTVTGPGEPVDVTGWTLGDLNAALPPAFTGNTRFTLVVETMGPDGATAVATSSQPVVLDPTQPVPDAVIGGDDRMATDEDTAVSGVLTITDPQAGEYQVAAATLDGAYGRLELQADGHWTYTPDDRADALVAGASAQERFTVTSADGTTHVVQVDLAGTDDASPVVGVASAQSSPDDSDLTASVDSTVTLQLDPAARAADPAADGTFDDDGGMASGAGPASGTGAPQDADVPAEDHPDLAFTAYHGAAAETEGAPAVDVTATPDAAPEPTPAPAET